MRLHFTTRNNDLIRRMGRLWNLLDLHAIKLQAKCNRSDHVGGRAFEERGLGRLQVEASMVRVGRGRTSGGVRAESTATLRSGAAAKVPHGLERPVRLRDGFSGVRLARGDPLLRQRTKHNHTRNP
ncbi:hypothetical protein CYMTET_52868 [Cymbomonas tetramitiformis]|uniref:Uncharacterized protein n=1 Tax=Cymbomonas tetramitiformis TaxID=36881 RepID=A0AAE0BJC5_9CHLO|nr:hypothetical protein CYMTET_52868 [Cymbomonas tetramitiformis]